MRKGDHVTNTGTGTKGTVTKATKSTVTVTRTDGKSTTYIGAQVSRWLRKP